MNPIRPATRADIARIAEIEVFNYRLNFYPIFKSDEYYFDELQVPRAMEALASDTRALSQTFVYDDGVVKGFIRLDGREIQKLFVEPVLQGQGIGAALLTFAVAAMHADTLWALEKNTRAIAFYARHGFRTTSERKLEEDTPEYLVRLIL